MDTKTEKNMSDDLDQLSAQAIISALENDEPVVVAAVREKILAYTAEAIESLKEGRDYLELLEVQESDSALVAIAKELVCEALDEEFEEEEV